MRKKYIVEVRDDEGKLDFEAKKEREKQHSYLFHKLEYTIDELCYYASYGQGRDLCISPILLPEFMDGIGLSYREVYW